MSDTIANLRHAPAAGIVLGTPRQILRAEGAALLIAAIAAYSALDAGWLLFAALFLAPDLFMLGYAANTRFGAAIYNLGHSTIPPLALIGLGWIAATPLVMALGLVWLAHIGFDRLIGYGLKYGDAFKHTHLGDPFPAKG
jgi:hypothetical protein